MVVWVCRASNTSLLFETLVKTNETKKQPANLHLVAQLLEIFFIHIDHISMTIFQPRRDNVSTWVITKEELLTWATETLVPVAKLAYDGKGEFRAGDHCLFCKAKSTCRKRAEYNLEMARYQRISGAAADI